MAQSLVDEVTQLLAFFRVLAQGIEVFLNARVLHVIHVKIVEQLVYVFVDL
jgi:hypothetical protein